MSVVAFVLAFALIFCSPAMACNYTCPTGTYNITTNNIINYGVMNYYSNSGSGDQVVYDYDYDCDNYVEYDDVYYEQIDTDSYCHLCGLTWDLCKCYDEVMGEYGGSCDVGWAYTEDCGYDYDDYSYDYSYGYGYEEEGTVMQHWANLRNASGEIIGCVGAGSSVEVIGVCEDNPSRSLIYDYTTGCYGTVASCYIWGGTAYEYEHPTEWGGYYGSGDTWACDNLEYEYGYADNWGNYEEEETYCGYGGYGEYEYCNYGCEYDECYDEVLYSDDDCGMYFLNNGVISNSDVNIKIDLSNSVINIYSGDEVILSGSCDTSRLACGNYSYCEEFAEYCGSFGGMIPNGCEICVRN